MSTARVRDLLERYKRLADERLRRDAERSLAAFVRQAWPILEPATPLLWNWHIDLVCEYLEAVTLGQITRLLINEPPRYMKSTKVSVLWPVWEWGPKNLPSTRWIFASFAMDLSTSHSISRRTVIESEWYRARWGERVQLTTDQNVKTEFQNTQRGRMLATSFSTGAMGKGGNRIVVDDPHKTRGVLSDTDREAVVREFREGLSDTRLDDKRTGAIVVVMQRLHQKDLSAYCLEQGYVHVKLENPCRKSVVITSPAGRRVQRTEGDLLWPAREGEKEMAAMRIALGPYGMAGQYGQEPSPPGGSVFKREWFKFYRELPADLDQHAESWDCAFKGTNSSDHVAGHYWVRKGANKYLVARVYDRMTFGATKSAVKTFRAAHPAVSHTYIEDKANGTAVIDELRDVVAGLVAVEPQGGKLARAHAVSGDVEAGNVYLPDPLDENGMPRPDRAWVHEFVEHCVSFTGREGEEDDDVDAMTQALTAMKKAIDAFGEYLKQEADRLARERQPAATQPEPLEQRDTAAAAAPTSLEAGLWGA